MRCVMLVAALLVATLACAAPAGAAPAVPGAGILHPFDHLGPLCPLCPEPCDDLGEALSDGVREFVERCVL